MTETNVDSAPVLDGLEEIEGWFFLADQFLFHWLLTFQKDHGVTGDLLELGVYKGKSAILLGSHTVDEEEFVVCDLFDSPAPDAPTENEMRCYYPTLTRRVFEENYLRFHHQLPAIVEGASSEITSSVEPARFRFVHIDASHLYPHVKGDIASARTLLKQDGIVALDDYRSPHTPGVAAATWEAVLNGGLKPIAVTESKFYGTWGDPSEPQKRLGALLAASQHFWGVGEEVAGHPLIHIHNR